MKAVHAYVRQDLAEHVIGTLISAGCRTMSVLDVRGITHDVPAGTLDYSVELAQRVEHVVKIEIICTDTDAVKWTDILVSSGSTRHRGDGLVCVLPVEHAVRVSTGARDDSAVSDLP